MIKNQPAIKKSQSTFMNTKNRKLRWGILGTSFISETMGKAINEDSGSIIQAVAGRRQEAIDSFAEQFSVVCKYDNYQALISDPDVDIVYIGLPNHLHHTYVLDSIAAGKHILCEKSLSIDMQKSQKMIDSVSDSQLFFIEGLMYLHHPLIKKLVDLLQSNVLGKVRTVSGQYCADIAQFVNPAGKGALYNLGCYPLSLLHLVLQTAYGNDVWSDFDLTGIGNISTKDGNICEASLNLGFPNGVTARLHTAETYGMFSDFVIVGEKGSLRFDSNPWLPEKSNKMTLTLFDEEPEPIRVTAEGDAFFYQVKHIREAILQGHKTLNRPAPRLQDSFEIMQILTRWEASILKA
ncbi:MAG: putative dehydrogenase [Cellvibrionaceae bacterium]|jgi:predicted dehydrogenase